MGDWVYPHTISKGPLKGTVIHSYSDYVSKFERVYGYKPGQKPKRAKTKPQSAVSAPTVRKIVETYELLRQEAVGRERALQILEGLFT